MPGSPVMPQPCEVRVPGDASYCRDGNRWHNEISADSAIHLRDRISDIANEPGDPIGVLATWCRLDSAGHVNAPRPDDRYGLGNVLRGEPAGEDQRNARVKTLEKFPWGLEPRAADLAFDIRIDQNCSGRATELLRPLDEPTNVFKSGGVLDSKCR